MTLSYPCTHAHADSTRWLQGSPKRRDADALPSSILDKLASALRTRLYLPPRSTSVRAALQDVSFEEYARLAVPDGGDVIRSSLLAAKTGDSRNASWIRVRASASIPLRDRELTCIQYTGLVDVNARFRNRPEVMRLDTAYGRLERILRFELPASPALKLAAPTTFCYAVIRAIELDKVDGLGLDLHFYTNKRHLEAIDAQFVECLVGRLKLENGRHVIIDRTGSIPRPLYIEDDELDNPAV
jgi:hypothetical protein